MMVATRSVVPAFILAGVAILVAIVTGVDSLGQPLRLVQLLKIVGLSVAAGVALMHAVTRRDGKTADSYREP
jgi:hypothetical protein